MPAFPRALTLLIALLWLTWAGGVTANEENDLQAAIEHARELSITKAVTASQPHIAALMNRLDEATPRQRAEIQLMHLRNLALQSRNEAAIEGLEALLESSPADDQRLRALRLAANVAINVGRYEWGLRRLKEALSLLSESDNPIEKSRVLSLAGFVHTLAGDHARSIQYSRQAFEIARQSGSLMQRCQSGQRLAVAYRYAGRLEQAQESARRALDDCRQADDQVYLGTVELEMAHLALERGDLEATEDWLEAGLQRLREAIWADGILTGRQLQARLAAARGQPERAIELATELVERVDERELWDRSADLHDLLATQHAALGDFSAAYRHRVEQVRARERFLDKDRRRRLAILEVEFDVARHEQALSLLREQRRVAELETEARQQQSRLRSLGLLLALLAFALVAMLLLRLLRERRHFRRLSRIDGLTGISNHTRFFDSARAMIDAAQRQGRPFVLVLGDIDHFKQVNDRHGHIAGDQALREVARRLREHFPGRGRVGRIGGEEFGVSQPGMDLTGTLDKLRDLRESLAGIDYGSDGKGLTMSFGVAVMRDQEQLEQLRRRADEALYRAKRDGRDSVVVDESGGA